MNGTPHPTVPDTLHAAVLAFLFLAAAQAQESAPPPADAAPSITREDLDRMSKPRGDFQLPKGADSPVGPSIDTGSYQPSPDQIPTATRPKPTPEQVEAAQKEQNWLVEGLQAKMAADKEKETKAREEKAQASVLDYLLQSHGRLSTDSPRDASTLTTPANPFSAPTPATEPSTGLGLSANPSTPALTLENNPARANAPVDGNSLLEDRLAELSSSQPQPSPSTPAPTPSSTFNTPTAAANNNPAWQSPTSPAFPGQVAFPQPGQSQRPDPATLPDAAASNPRGPGSYTPLQQSAPDTPLGPQSVQEQSYAEALQRMRLMEEARAREENRKPTLRSLDPHTAPPAERDRFR